MAASTKWKAWQFDSEADARRVRHVLESRYPRQSFESLGDRLVASAKVTGAELQEIADRLNIIGPTPLASLYEPRNSAGGRRSVSRSVGRRNRAGGKSALVERAVQAARLYMGADTASIATQQKLYRRMAAAVERVAKHYGMDAISASEQIEREARSRGPVRPLAGKDY